MSKALSLVLVLLLVAIGHARADPLTEDMTKLNARWDAAINDPNFDALLPMYAADASLMPPGAAPVSGPTAIRDFFAKRGTSVRNHKLELVEVLQMGDYAYVTSRFKASLVKGDETTILSGIPLSFMNTSPTANGRLSPIFSFGNSQGALLTS
jgi:ketosteroid isomerase-like protein